MRIGAFLIPAAMTVMHPATARPAGDRLRDGDRPISGPRLDLRQRARNLHVTLADTRSLPSPHHG